MTDAEQAAYWKGAYDRMAARNIKLTEALQNMIGHHDFVSKNFNIDCAHIAEAKKALEII